MLSLIFKMTIETTQKIPLTLWKDGTIRVDGEPLESARVESRVRMTFLTREAKDYSLSLWVMFTDGETRTVELGRFRTMLEVSQAAGTIEAFLTGDTVQSSPASSSSVGP